MGAIMQIRPIRTDKDHRAALAEIEKLWGASCGRWSGPAHLSTGLPARVLPPQRRLASVGQVLRRGSLAMCLTCSVRKWPMLLREAGYNSLILKPCWPIFGISFKHGER